jgi:hypothetical protein
LVEVLKIERKNSATWSWHVRQTAGKSSQPESQ